ncbi:MAG TPA: hypothetical protein ENH60_12205 [Pricia sp.]|nr:hypothetical protein [Pricia sp.]
MSEVKKGKHLSPKTEFKKGHKTWNKGIPRSDAVKKAVSKANYKNGKIRTAQGYILKLQRNNPHRRKRYILEHRLIMEKILGRYLTKKEKVHHINGIKHDNRPQNLHLVAQSPHYGKICCPFCSKEFLIR